MSLANPRGEPSGPMSVPSGAGTGPLTCRDVIGLLLDRNYPEQELCSDVIPAFERHLDDCASCRVYLKTYDRSRQLVGEVSRVEMPAELRARLRALLVEQLMRGDSESPDRPRRGSPFGWGA